MEMNDGRNKMDWFVCPFTEGGSKLNWQTYPYKMTLFLVINFFKKVIKLFIDASNAIKWYVY